MIKGLINKLFGKTKTQPIVESSIKTLMRIGITPRLGWKGKVEATGLVYHSAGGRYWREDVYYHFPDSAVREMENQGNLLVDRMVWAARDLLKNDRQLLLRAFPEPLLQVMEAELNDNPLPAYGRFDFAYDKQDQLKMFEYNADTPVCLIEGSLTQADWVNDMYERGDFIWKEDVNHPVHYQFNYIYECLKEFFKQFRGETILFCCGKGSQLEYEASCLYLSEVAAEVGVDSFFRWVEDLGLDNTSLQIVDDDNEAPDHIFSLYPKEWWYQDMVDGGHQNPEQIFIANSFIEKPYKLLLGGKFMLAELYKRYPNWDVLIPAWHTREECLDKKVVAKTWYGRIGLEVEILEPGQQTTLQGPVVYQEYIDTKQYDGHKVAIGTWHINNMTCGIGVREQTTEITTDECTFAPHIVDFIQERK